MLWNKKVLSAPIDYARKVRSLPSDITCWHSRKDIDTSELLHRSMVIDRATNDPFRQQFWSYEFDSRINHDIKIQKIINGDLKIYCALRSMTRLQENPTVA